MSAAEQEPVARMAVPSEGGCCGAIFVILFVGSFVALAVLNLANHAETRWWALIPSVLWLALVAFAIWVVLWQAGLRALAVGFLGTFARRDFVEAACEGGRVVIGFGFTLFGLRFYHLRVPVERVASVNMSSGQGTALAGRDMNDWHVAVWYHDPDSREKLVAGLPANELHLVGPARAKAKTEELLHALVEFLRAAGVELRPGEKEYEFRAAGAGGPASPPPSPAPSA